MASITSNGTGGGNLSNGASWSGGVAPTTGDTIIVAAGDTIIVDISIQLGSKASGVGHAFTINGSNSSSYGTLQVASGVTLTLQGYDTGSNTLGYINQYGLFAPQPGSTVLGDVAANFGSIIINKGRFEALGSSGSRITFSVPSANVNWASSVTSEAKTPGPYDTGLSIASVALGNPQIGGSAGTGIGSLGDTSLTVNSSTPSLTTEVALAGDPATNVTSAGKYAIDYDAGIIYLYAASFAGMAINTSYTKLDKSSTNWRGWGIISNGATTYNTALFSYCDFSYMGAYGNGVLNGSVRQSAPLNLVGHQTAGYVGGGDTSRLAYVENCTFNHGYRYILLTSCYGALGDPLLITGNTFNDASGGTIWDGLGPYAGTCGYVKIDSNAFNTRGMALYWANLTADSANIVVSNNTGCVALTFFAGSTTPFPTLNLPDSSYGNIAATPDLSISGNSVRGAGESTLDTRFLYLSGTSGHPAVVQGNWFHHTHRLGHRNGSYVQFLGNRFGMSYHHGFTGASFDDLYVTDVTYQNNLFYCDRGSGNSTSAAIQCGYNHRVTLNNLVIANNTCDGFKYGLLDFGDIPDSNGPTSATNIVVVNNAITNGQYAFGRYQSSTMPNNLHVLECDYNDIYGQTVGFAGGTNTLAGTKCTGFTLGGSKYNRLTGASRNINGVALFDATYTTTQAGKNLVYTVTTLGQNHTVAWDGGTAQQLIYDYGTSAGQGFRTVAVSGKSTWPTNNNSIRTKWMWVVSGTGAGQARQILWATANTAYAATVTAGGSYYSIGQYLQTTTGTKDSPGGNVIVKVTGVSAGVITAVQIISGGTFSTAPTNPAATQRITGSSGSGCTLTLSFAPGLLFTPDLATALDATSVIAIHEAMVSCPDSGTGSVKAGFYLPDPSNVLSAIQIPSSTATDSGIVCTVANSPTSNPTYSGAGLSSAAVDYKWSAGSPLQDAGTSDNAPSTDYFGTSRPQGSAQDIGMYELIASAGPVYFVY